VLQLLIPHKEYVKSLEMIAFYNDIACCCKVENKYFCLFSFASTCSFCFFFLTLLLSQPTCSFFFHFIFSPPQHAEEEEQQSGWAGTYQPAKVNPPHSDRTGGNGFKLKEGRFRLKKETVYCEGGEALAQVAQRSCGCPLPGSVQGQAGRGFEQPGLVGGVPARGRGLELDDL